MFQPAVYDVDASKKTDADYLIFYSSIVQPSNTLWCPDCVRVETLIDSAFKEKDSPKATIVYVGQRSEWKTPKNAFRGEPWAVNSVPTIIRLRDNAKLVDDEINANSLKEFISN